MFESSWKMSHFWVTSLKANISSDNLRSKSVTRLYPADGQKLHQKYQKIQFELKMRLFWIIFKHCGIVVKAHRAKFTTNDPRAEARH